MVQANRWERSAGPGADASRRKWCEPCRSSLPYGDPEDYPDEEDEEEEEDEDFDEEEEDEDEEEEPEWYVRPDACPGRLAAL